MGMKVRKAPATKTDKQLAIRAIGGLPDSAPMARIAEELAIPARIRRGEEAADAGRSMPLDQFKHYIEQWLTESRLRNRRKLSAKG